MLQVGALLQRQQGPWGVTMMGCPVGRSARKEGLRVGIGSSCQGRDCNWSRGFRSTHSALRRSRNERSAVVAAMENSSVEQQRATEAMESNTLAVGGDRREKWSSTLNREINKASKWVVVLLVVGGILWRHNDHAVWFAIGSAVSGGWCKLLKYLINQSRPPTADGVKADPGMPSSHAHGFFYIAAYVSLSWLLWQGVNVWSCVTAFGIVLSVAYLSWLRVEEGLHTLPQVLVGGTLGSAVGVFWLYLWTAGVETAVNSSSTAKLFLYVAFIAAGIFCYFISFKDWELGKL